MKFRGAFFGALACAACQNSLAVRVELQLSPEVSAAVAGATVNNDKVFLTFRACRVETQCDEFSDFIDQDSFDVSRQDLLSANPSFVFVPGEDYQSGENVFFEVSVSTLQNNNGEVLGYSRSFFDVPGFFPPRQSFTAQLKPETAPIAIQTGFVPLGATVSLKNLRVNAHNPNVLPPAQPASPSPFNAIFAQEALNNESNLPSYPFFGGIQIRRGDGDQRANGILTVGACVNLTKGLVSDFSGITVVDVTTERPSVFNCDADVRPIAPLVVPVEDLDNFNRARPLDAVLVQLAAPVMSLDVSLAIDTPAGTGDKLVHISNFAYDDNLATFAGDFFLGRKMLFLIGALELFKGDENPDPEDILLLPRTLDDGPLAP
jgi:hypothetical protein